MTSQSEGSSSLLATMAEKFSMNTEELVGALKSTAFKLRNEQTVSDEQLISLLSVCNTYNLNPFVREIYALQKGNGDIIPTVSIDGWVKIANNHDQFDGIEFEYSEEMVTYEHEAQGENFKVPPCHSWIEATLYRKDRSKPVVIREYLDECYRIPYSDELGLQTYKRVWQTHPKRVLRHKVYVQVCRIGLGLVGIYDEDEALGIVANDAGDASPVETSKTISNPVSSQTPKPSVAPGAKISDEDKKEIDITVDKLAERCAASNEWQGAVDYISERLTGDKMAYALSRIDVLKADSPQNKGDDVKDEVA